MASAQTGKTEMELNMMGRAIDTDPGPMLFIQPTDTFAEDFSKRRLAPAIRDCAPLKRKVAAAMVRSAANTTLKKRFPGGMLTMKGLGILFDMKGSGLPRFGAKHAIGIDQWKWVIPLIAIGIAYALFYMLCEFFSKKLAAMLKDRRVTSCLIAGVLVAVCGFLVPLSMYSGEHQLHQMIDEWQEYAAVLLFASAVVKLFLTSFCINLGWKGGNIFPIIFCGAIAGFGFALLTGMDGGFAAAVVISALYGYLMRKPVAVIAVLMLCFPVTYILPIAAAAFISAKIPSPVKPDHGNDQTSV